MVTELRVHGVSGTPAESMLDRPIVGRVAGDGDAGFYRPRPEYGGQIGPGGDDLEAYRWGNLTAGAAARAFWLLLLPFTLTNVAVWLRPPSGRFGRALVRGLCRVFALSVTATFALAAVGVALDLFAWQCAAPGSRCTVDRPWLTFLFTGWFEPTGRRLALAALGPILVMTLLWELSRRSWARYESFTLPEVTRDGDGLSAPSFWYGRVQVGRLRTLHVTSAFAIIDAVLLYVLLRHDRARNAYAGIDLGQTTPASVRTIGTVLAVLVGAVLATCVVTLFMPGMVSRDAPTGWAGNTAKVLRWLTVLLTVATLGYALLPRATWPATGALPGYAATVTWLFAGQSALLGVLMLVIAFQRGKAKGALFGGFGAPIVASLGLGLGAAFSAGFSYRVADYLDKGAVPSPANFAGPAASGRLEPPVSFQWAAFAFVVAVLVLLLGGVWVRLVTLPSLRRKARADTDEDYPGDRARNPRRAAAIDAKIANARLADHLSRTFAFIWVLLGAAALVTTGLALTGRGPVQLATSGSLAAQALHFTTNLGTYLISLTALALIVLGIQAYRNERVRRVVGVIWDLATFWPRAAHPFGAPCYAERVVPELVNRASWLATRQGGVVLSGHSQGSVLAVATVLQMPKPARDGTALLTYGAPLRRLYARAFPAYLNDAVFGQVGRALADPDGQPRWTNLWRRTDPIGGHVDTEGLGGRALGRAKVPGALSPSDGSDPAGRIAHCADVRLVDPVAFDPEPGDMTAPQIRAHSDYQISPGFGEAVKGLNDRLPGAP